MNSEAMERANELLATAPTPDVTELKDGAQVGLHVVAELAKREGILVSLRRSAYGGLLAIVLLPDQIIATDRAIATEPADSDIDLTDADFPAPATVAPASRPVDFRRQDRRPVAAGVVTVSNGSAVTLRNTDGGGGRRPDHAGGTMSDHQSSSGAGIPRQPESPIARGAAAAAPSPPVAARPPLPHRQPQQHLAPELRDDNLPDTGSQGVVAARSPEEARDRLARYQQRWADGRAAGNDDTVTRADQGRKT